MQTATSVIEIEEFPLSSGKRLEKISIAFETVGRLSEKKDNAVLVFHALSGSAHIAGINEEFSKECAFWTEENITGWWDGFVGNGKLIDSKENFVICMNILGGCYGTTGPSSTSPKTGKPYGSSFPEISIEDMARLQERVLERLGVEKLKAVIGSSMGGYIALEFCMLFGERVKKAIIIGSAASTSSLNKLHNLEQIIAIENDPNFNNGDYYGVQKPDKGLMLARMIGGKRYVDIDTINERAKKEVVLPSDYIYGYKLQHHVESYIFHQGKNFVKRFDANSYLLIVKAMQSFDLARKYGQGSLESAFSKMPKGIEFLIVSIDSDVCYFTEEQDALVNALQANGVSCTFELVHSVKGHDSFLLEPERYYFLKDFLEGRALDARAANESKFQKKRI